jgi:hypothetical protein
MLIDAKTRRIAIQLQGARGQTIIVVSSRAKVPNIWADSAVLDDVSLDSNSAILLFGTAPNQTSVSVPLDAIETAWKDARGWYMTIAGVIETVEWNPGIASDRLRGIKMLFSPRSQ